jgi:diacylglycerol kinase family enzyme
VTATESTDDVSDATRTTSVALVLNPVKVTDAAALREGLAERCARAGLAAPLVLETTEEDPGVSMAREAVAAGATVVAVAGGDGTVRAVAEGLTGTGVALAVVPQGTGNLLARNLELPLDVDTALDAVVDGTDRRIDVGRLVGGDDEGTVFTIMAGAGFDAAMMRDAPEGLKAAVGWPAYLVGGARGMRRQRARLELVVDGGAPVRARVRTVLVGNLGKLQGGLELLPDARPDDGLLDVALVAPRNPFDWARLAWRGLTGRHRTDHRLRTWQAREVDVRLQRPQPRQVDGDLVPDRDRLTVRVEPGALVVRVPKDAGHALDATRPADGAADPA